MQESSPTSVYLYYDEHGVLVYVGVTSRTTRRQAEHNKSKAWWPFVRSQQVEHFATRSEALRREAELIETYGPPFNVQRNRDHEATRVAFLAYRESIDTFADPMDLFRHHKKQMPLTMVSQVDRDAVLSTAPTFAPVAARLHLAGGAPAFAGNAACGSVARAYAHGPVTFLALELRRGIRVGAEPFVRLKAVSAKGGYRFTMASVVVASEDEYDEMKGAA